MAIRNYKLELENPNTREKVSFGPRKLGDVGRDILIAKATLGQLVDYSSLLDEGDNNPSFETPDGWFDCATGVKVTNKEAATFDRKFQVYLTKFQLDNQFYILSYLFNKFLIGENLEKINNLPARPFETPERLSYMNSLLGGVGLPGGGMISFRDELSIDIFRSRYSVPASIPPEDSDNISKFRRNAYISSIIEVMISMFDISLGTLDEATIAVMHGWVPRSRVGKKTYHHDERVFSNHEFVYDLVILGLWDSFVSGLLSQKLENSPAIIEPTSGERDLEAYSGLGSKALSFKEIYKEQVASSESLYLDNPEYVLKSTHFGVLKYEKKSKESESPLYSNFIKVSNDQPRDRSAENMSSKDYSDSFNRAFEPDPLTDPDPYIINGKEIGFFDITEYSLSNLPPKAPDENSTEEDITQYRNLIRELEDKALTKVLHFYGKPNVWSFKKDDLSFISLFGSVLVDVKSPLHDESYFDSNSFVLTTNETARRLNIQLTSATNRNTVADILGKAENYNNIDYSNYEQNISWNISEEPLILFKEFRTPSLRVGDHYRAQFIINRRKLDLIQEGAHLQTSEEEDEDTSNQADDIEPTLPASNNACDSENISEEEQQRRYEEYKSLAIKRKTEIKRILREAQIESYNNQEAAESASVQLGVFGNANIGITEFRTQGESFRNALFDELGRPLLDAATFGLLESFNDPNEISNVENPKMTNFKQLKITYQELKNKISESSKNLKEAYEECRKEKVTFTNLEKDSISYNGAQESIKLADISQ